MKRITAFVLISLYCISLSTLLGQSLSEAENSSAATDSLSGQLADENTPANNTWGWTVHKLDGNRLRWQPAHELDYSLTRLPGVLSRNNKLFVRGSLEGEIGYFLDGISINNPYNNSAGIPLILEAMETVDFHTGAYGTQFGGANGALAHITMRKGGEALTDSVDLQTDDFSAPGESFLGAGSSGYRRFVGTAQGMVAGLRFFAAGQHRYLRNRQPMFLEPFRFEGLETDGLGPSGPAIIPLPGSVEFKRNYLYNNWLMENTVQGNLTYSLEQFEIRAFGSYSFEEHPEGTDWSSALENYFRKRRMMNETTTMFGALQLTHRPSESTSFTVSFSAYDRFNEVFDLDFGDEWQLYTDSLTSREKGYVTPGGSDEFISRFRGPYPYSVIYNFEFAHPFTPNNYYTKNNQTSYSLTAEATTEILPFWQLSGGGKIDWWTMRMYRISDISGYMTGLYGTPPRTFASDSARRAYAFSAGSIAAYGYDHEGTETDNKIDSPRKPELLSFFINNKLTISDFTFDVGGRFECFASGALIGSIDDLDQRTEQKADRYFLPRINVLFNPSSQYSFYAAFGKYAQLPALENVLQGTIAIDVPNSDFNVYFPTSGDRYLEPLRSTQYEVGGAATVLDAFSFSARMYYKSLFNLLGIARAIDSQGNIIFVGYRTVQEEAVARGLELTTRVMFFTGASFDAHYALSDWRVPGVSGDANARPSQRFVTSLDYHSTASDAYVQGGIFAGVGFTLLFTAESGLPYTRIAEIRNLGSSSPWTIGVRSLTDPRSNILAEPPYSSSTPWSYYLDLKISASVLIGPVQTELYAAMLNILNTKNIQYVYPQTGSPDNDGWLDTPFASAFKDIPNYEAFYRAINQKNHWAFSQATGADMYGKPRELRIGMRVTI